jgi:TolA-binding protein
VTARRALLPGVLLALVAVSTSCAYYNTFYLARKYYDRATNGAPYVPDKPDGSAAGNFTKSIDYSKKLLANYPKSKWVDDAYLLWARSLIGKDDPIQTMNMLRDFSTRYPKSSLKDEALFYMGVGARRARKQTDALAAFDDFLKAAPKHELAPYALLERSAVLLTLERPAEAAASAGQVLERFPRSKLADRALKMRAEALLAQGDATHARADYRVLGSRALTDEERFGYLLKEAECLEVARRYDEERALLQDAAGHEQAPDRPQTGGGQVMPTSASNERWGRLMLRIGAVDLLAGRTDRALDTFLRVIDLFPRTPLAAEGQYRVAYTYETAKDDFDRARVEYGKVQVQSSASQYAAQAALRLASLERLAQYRKAGAGVDSVGKKAEAGFLLAEQYLFQLDKPDRAIEQYRVVAHEFHGTGYAGKAINAEAWVLRNKYSQKEASDSLLWVVVRNYPKTEAQMNARDYLERYGHDVPSDLIQPPDPPASSMRDTVALTPPPAQVDSIGVRHRSAAMDSLLRQGMIRAGEAPGPASGAPHSSAPMPMTPAPLAIPAPADSQRVTRDSLAVPPPPSPKPDSTGKRP